MTEDYRAKNPAMEDTDPDEAAGESAELVWALKHEPLTKLLEAEVIAWPGEAAEAVDQVVRGLDTADPGSYVAHYLASYEV